MNAPAVRLCEICGKEIRERVRRCATCRPRWRHGVPRSAIMRSGAGAPVRLDAEDHAALDRKPRTRAECADVPRPCPHVSCVYNLYLDVTEAGSIKLNFPHLQPGDMEPSRSCALDVADAADSVGVTLEEIGEIMNLTRERVRQVELLALFHARRGSQALGLDISEVLHEGQGEQNP